VLRSTLRALRSRLARTALTVAGIAIGILALVVVGSLAERLSTIVARSTAVNGGAIFAFSGDAEARELAGSERLQAARAIISRFDGVRAVVPEVILPYRLGFSQSTRFGPPSLIFGMPPGARQAAGDALHVGSGRDLRVDERGGAVVGTDFASAEGVALGDTIALYGNSYPVVGIIAKSFTVFDAAVVVPFADAQSLALQLVPPEAFALPRMPATALLVTVRPHADTALIARRIGILTGLRARDPAQIANSVRSTTDVFDAIIFGAALVALLVGAFSIVNTMTIAVSERTREIGIRKAIGAGDGDVLREFLFEASLIGAIGGAVGLACASVVVAVVDAHNARSGNLELFAITPRLAIGSLGFAVLLSTVAGLAPAIRAARLEPTDALRRLG